jgi:ribosomal protein S18 acetylase RimI-like enzyme
MSDDSLRNVGITELTRTDAPPIKLHYRYLTPACYDLSIHHETDSWRIELTLKTFMEPLERVSDSRFYEEFVEEPRAFAAELDGKQVGWIELGYHKWNNRMRIWEILVREEYRRRDIGTLLMDYAVKIAKEKGARALVLETQSCNAPAITFYLKYGFELIGFDSTAYSNDDIQKKEVRLEMGLRLAASS